MKPYTSHGHPTGAAIPAGTPVPTTKAKCGGSAFCSKCAAESGNLPGKLVLVPSPEPVEVVSFPVVGTCMSCGSKLWSQANGVLRDTEGDSYCKYGEPHTKE